MGNLIQVVFYIKVQNKKETNKKTNSTQQEAE